MRKNVILILLLIIITFGCTNDVTTLIKDNNFLIRLVRHSGEYTSYYGSVSYYNNKWDAYSTHTYITVSNVCIEKQCLKLRIITSRFNSFGSPNYWEWNYPVEYEIEIVNSELKEIIKFCKDNPNDQYDLFFDEAKTIKTLETTALCISDNLRIKETPDLKPETKVIGKLQKFQEVTLIDVTSETEKIGKFDSPWYKVKLEDGNIGWVYGAYVKIYFDEKDKGYLYKAFEAPGSDETNNQEYIPSFY